MNNINNAVYPKTGVGVMLIKSDSVLLGKRKGSHGEGQWAFPGGHLEYLESFETCARREIFEETGLEIKSVSFLYLANITQYAPKHYTHVGLVAEWDSGEPKLLEPDKCEGWEWFPLSKQMPSPMFLACELSLYSYKVGKNYFDIKDIEKYLIQQT